MMTTPASRIGQWWVNRGNKVIMCVNCRTKPADGDSFCSDQCGDEYSQHISW